MQQPNGAESQPTIQDVVRDATITTHEMLKAFVTTAQLAQFPANLIGPAGFQLAMQMIMLNNQTAFHNGVIDVLCEVLARTKATDGGLDPKAIQREMARRNVAVAMGPDPEILQQLVQGSNHASAVQQGEMEDLRAKLAHVREFLQDLATPGLEPITWGRVQERAQAILDLGLADNAHEDPGSIPENRPLNGTLPTEQEPQP